MSIHFARCIFGDAVSFIPFDFALGAENSHRCAI